MMPSHPLKLSESQLASAYLRVREENAEIAVLNILATR
jgi:hypothetical protein